MVLSVVSCEKMILLGAQAVPALPPLGDFCYTLLRPGTRKQPAGAGSSPPYDRDAAKNFDRSCFSFSNERSCVYIMWPAS